MDKCLFNFASWWCIKDKADPVSSIISTIIFHIFPPVITVALSLTVATVTSCGLMGGDHHCPKHLPPGHFPVDKFSSNGLAVHK